MQEEKREKHERVQLSSDLVLTTAKPPWRLYQYLFTYNNPVGVMIILLLESGVWITSLAWLAGRPVDAGQAAPPRPTHYDSTAYHVPAPNSD